MDASQLLQQLIAAEKAIERYETRQKRLIDRIGVRIAEIETLATDCRSQLNDILKQSKTTDKNGEPIVVVEGATVDYVVEYTKPTGAVKVVSADAVPDEFCKTETKRSPKLKEIKDHMKTNQVNWASLEFGKPQVTWRPRKK